MVVQSNAGQCKVVMDSAGHSRGCARLQDSEGHFKAAQDMRAVLEIAGQSAGQCKT
jgi:hypothetical protein